MATQLSKLLTSRLTAVKKHVFKYCERVYERSGRNHFGVLEIQVKFQINLKLDISKRPVCLLMIVSTLFTTLPNNFTKDKLIYLIERTFNREGSPYLACFTLEKSKKISCIVLSKCM